MRSWSNVHASGENPGATLVQLPAEKRRARTRNLASGAAAAVLSMIRRRDSIQPPVPHLPTDARDLTQDTLAQLLRGLWAAKTDQHADTLIRLTWEAIQPLRGSPQG